MSIVKLLLIAFFVWTPRISAVEFATSCTAPRSVSGRTAMYEPVEPALPIAVTEVAQIGNTVSITLSVVTALGTTQVAQGTRANSILQITSCNDASQANYGPLSWSDSPTQLSIGDSSLQYSLGAVVGNWALLGGTVAGWSLAANRYGTAMASFPGGLTLPVLFLMSPTVTSAVSLLRDGTVTQQILGGCSLTAQVLGTGLVAVFLHPSHFGARWGLEGEKPKWVDAREENYVKHYGMLFKDYREGRHWFLSGELLMSMATGAIKSYLMSEGNCRPVVTAAAAVSTTYALSLLTLYPNLDRRERIFYGAVAGLEALALTIQAASLWAASEDTQQNTRAVAESIVMVAEYALLAKSLFDVGRRIWSIYKYLCIKPAENLSLDTPLLPVEATQREMVNAGADHFPEPCTNEVPSLDVPEPVVLSSDHVFDPSDHALIGRLRADSLWVDPNNPNPLDQLSAPADSEAQ